MRQRKRKAGKSKRLSTIWKIGVGILTLLLLIDVYLLITSRIFNIKSVDVILDKVNCIDENSIKQEVSVFGKNFFLINGRKLEKQIKDKYFCIKYADFKKEFPNKIKIKVFGREAIAVLVLLKDEEASKSASLEETASSSAHISKDSISDEFLVDSEGVIFSKAVQINAPRLYFWGKLTLGKKIAETIIENSLIILEKLKTFGVFVNEAKIYSNNILLLNPETNKPIMIFSLTDKVEIQLASLQLILTQAKIDKEEMEFIDLRYDKPVVKYAPKKGE